MNSIEHYLQNIYLNAQPPSKKVSEHECIRLLWIKVILRAAYDWVLYRNSRSHISKKIAEDLKAKIEFAKGYNLSAVAA